MMVPTDLMAPHTKLFGMTGSGKTITIRLMLQHLVDRATSANNIKIVVFDPKRELYSYILGMDPMVPVLLFDATDQRGVAWDIAADITEPNHAKAAAKLFVPDENSSQPYFSRAARRILEWVIRHLIDHASHWNLQDVFMILKDLSLLQQILPPDIVRKYFKPEATLRTRFRPSTHSSGVSKPSPPAGPTPKTTAAQSVSANSRLCPPVQSSSFPAGWISPTPSTPPSG